MKIMVFAGHFLMAAFMLLGNAMAELPPNTSVVSMLQLIPDCAIPCTLKDLFQVGGCPMTNASELSNCVCSNITIQSHFSACAQQSCGFRNIIKLASFAGDLCSAYPKESRVHELKTIAITTIVLSLPILLLRLYSRWLNNRCLWADDVFAIVAGLCLITVSLIILLMAVMGFGLHYWNVPATSGVVLLKLYYACQMLYILVQVFSKVAILSLYSRIFPKFIHWFQWTVRGMIIFMFTHGFVFFLMVTFQCVPISSIWDKTISGKCLPVAVAIGYVGAGLSIAEDFIILLLPVKQLWALQMSYKKKTCLVLLLSVGSFASIASIIRLRYILKYANTFDSTWDNVDVLKWSLIEILLACICGNLMPLRPLVERMTPSIRFVLGSYFQYSREPSEEQSRTSLNWFGRYYRSFRGSNPASTTHFVRVDQAPSRDKRDSLVNKLTYPTAPSPVYFEKRPGVYERLPISANSPQLPSDTDQKPAATPVDSTNGFRTEITAKTGEDLMRMSSGKRLVPPQHPKQRYSGPWSYALTIFDRS